MFATLIVVAVLATCCAVGLVLVALTGSASREATCTLVVTLAECTAVLTARL